MTHIFISQGAEMLASPVTVESLSERAKRADMAEFDRLLTMVPKGPPDEGDEWPASVEKPPPTSDK